MLPWPHGAPAGVILVLLLGLLLVFVLGLLLGGCWCCCWGCFSIRWLPVEASLLGLLLVLLALFSASVAPGAPVGLHADGPAVAAVWFCVWVVAGVAVGVTAGVLAGVLAAFFFDRVVSVAIVLARWPTCSQPTPQRHSPPQPCCRGGGLQLCTRQARSHGVFSSSTRPAIHSC